MLAVTWLTPQLVFNGLVNGLLIGLLAMAMVLVYRSTRVVNFAVGNIGLIGAGLLPLLVLDYGVPYWVGLAICLACGTLFAAVSELTVIRRLFDAPRVIVLVATVGIAQLAAGVAAAYPDLEASGNNYPLPIPTVFDDVLGLRVTGTQLAVIIAVLVVFGGLMWLLRRTTLGHTVEAAADNASLARLSGVNPKLLSTFVWTAAGFASTVAMVSLSTLGGAVGGLDNLGPIMLSRAMIAFVLAGMRSYPRAVAWGAFVGVGEAILRFNSIRMPGLFDLVGLAVVLVVIAVRNRPWTAEVFAFGPKVKARPVRVAEVAWLRRGPKFLVALVAVGVAVLPLVVTLPSRQLVYASIACFAICALSLLVVTGWAGQLSLAQMTFAGFGALLSAALSRGLELDVWLVDFEAPRLPFLLAIPLAAVVVTGFAVMVGLGALRVRGLELAVITFVFAVAAQQYIYRIPVFSDGNSNSVTFRRGSLFGLSLDDHRTYYYFCVAVLALVMVFVSRLGRSAIGRSTIAVRDNPDAAAAYTVSPTRTKLLAFATAGGIAAIGGSLLAGLVQSVPFGERYFRFDDSLQLVGMLVIGGLAARVGPVLGALWVVGLPAFFPGNEVVPLFTSSIGLLLVVMYFPGGFAQIGYAIRDAVDEWAIRRLPPAPPPVDRPTVTTLSITRGGGSAPSDSDATVLRTDHLSVRYGGNLAVVDAGIEVRAGETVGLIGTNGAGKSTLLDAIGGFVRARGSVQLLGEEVSGLSVTARAQRGLGRTFQTATLFPELSVRDTIRVALEARGRTGFGSAAIALPRARRMARTRRAEADELISFLGLGRYADSYVADLSTGTRRVVELANLLAVNGRVLCLDEPTAGLAQRETEAFGPLLVSIREEMDASMVIVEHDMPLIMSISNRVYCLELGTVIAAGPPDMVRNDPNVIASYLGTNERAIARSNSDSMSAASPDLTSGGAV